MRKTNVPKYVPFDVAIWAVTVKLPSPLREVRSSETFTLTFGLMNDSVGSPLAR